MKIVQVIENFFPDSVGGTETYVLNISRWFIDAGHEVHIIAPSINGSREYVYSGINVHRYRIDPVATKDEYKQLVPPKGLHDFLALLDYIRPDVVHFNTFNRAVNIYHLKAVKAKGFKTYLTPHVSGIFCATGSLIDYNGLQCDGVVCHHDCIKCYLKTNGHSTLTSILTNIGAWFINKSKLINRFIPASSFIKKNRIDEFKDLNNYADGVIALSPWIETALKANGINNTLVVKQGISKQLINNDTHDLKPYRHDKLRLIYVGRVYQIKNLETLYNAFVAIEPEKIELTMVCICGNDDYAQKLKSQFCALSNVEWRENVPQTELGKILKAHDFLVLTSISEMSPLVILESFANRVPIIGTDIPPIRDNVINGYNGLLFPVSNYNALADIFAQCLITKTMVTDFKNNILNPRTFCDVANDLLEIYNN